MEPGMAVDADNPRSSSRGFPSRKILSRVMLFLAFLSNPALARQREKPAQPLKRDELCLACHARPDKHASSLHGALGCTDCHTSVKDFPHAAKIAKVKCETCQADAGKSIHAVLGEDPCTSCHGNVHEVMAAARLQPGKCAECHAAEV